MPSLIRSSRGYGKNNSSQVTDVNAKNTSLLLTGDQTSKPWIADNSLLNADSSIFDDTKPSNLNPFEEGFYSNYFDGTTDYITTAAHTSNQLTGNFTIEFWFYAIGTGGLVNINSATGPNSSTGLSIYLDTGAVLKYFVNGNGTVVTGPTITTGLWYHVALVRSGSTNTLYLDGVSRATSSATPSYGLASIGIGRIYNDNTSFVFNGYISNVRIIKGVALYTSDFIPQNQPLTRTPETIFLSCQSSQIIDRSIYSIPFTVTGDVRVRPFNPFEKNLKVPQYVNIGSNSVYFDGNGDYLTGPANTSLITTGQFTIEFWINVPSHASNRALIFNSHWDIGQNGGFRVYLLSAGTIEFSASTGAYNTIPVVFTSTSAVPLGWSHIAIVRNASNSISCYINGILASTPVTYASSLSLSSDGNIGQLRIGVGIYDGGVSDAFTGYISNLRMVNGTAVYTAAFTPPTAPLTAIANTSLLICQSTTIVDNGPSAFAITASGNAATADIYLDTPVYKSLTGDDGSISFDGTGDYITIPYDNRYNIPASTPFTFEAWVYTTATTEFHLLNRNWAYGGSGPTVAFYLSSGNAPSWQIGGTGASTYVMLNNGTAGKLGQWNHYVWSRDASNVCRIFTNGVEATSVTRTDSQALTATSGAIFVGVSSNLASQYTNGQISNMRFVVGSCIYTRNFKPPTEPLTAIPNTVLLMAQSRIPNNNKLFFDDSNAMNTVTPTGNATKTSFSPFGSNWSYYCSANGASVTIPSAPWTSLAGQFTVEVWVNYSQPPTNEGGHFGNYATGGWQLYTDPSGRISPALSGTGNIFNSTFLAADVKIGKWYHIAVTRNNANLMTMWVDGVSVGSTTTSTTYTAGTWSIGSAYAMFVSGFQVWQTCKYTASFTPSTKPTIPTETRVSQYSGYFDGSGDCISYLHDMSYTSVFTIEFWFYATISQTDKYMFAGSASPFILINGTMGLGVGREGTIHTYTASNYISAGRWYHLAYVREGTGLNQLKLYLDGSLVFTTNDSTSFTGSSAVIGAFRDSSSQPFTGHISNFRLVKGQAIYTGSFTPPTSPLTLSQTSSTNISSILSSTIPTNGGSVYFDGTGDLLTFTQPAIGTSPFTIEFWIYLPATNSDKYLYAGSGATGGPLILLNTSGGISVGVQGGFTLTGTPVLSVGQWNHIAVVREGTGGSQLKLYYNGTSVGSTTMSSNFSSGLAAIGGGDTGGQLSTCYISNFRLINGVAAYTGNFTPPTSPLATTQSAGTNVSAVTAVQTSLLTCQSNTFIDNSSSPLTITVNGGPTIYASESPFGFANVKLLTLQSTSFADQTLNNLPITVNGDTFITTFNPFTTPPPTIITAVSNRFEDKSSAGAFATPVGNVRITKNTPFENYRLTPATYSVYFDGTTDVLNIQGNFHYFRNSGANNQGDFCVEGWFYPRKNTANLWTLGNEFPGRLSCFITGNKLNLNLYGGSTTPLAGVPSNTWTHIAITRANAIVSAYINGTLSNSTVIAGNIGLSSNSAGTSPLWIGSDSSGSGNFEGYISNFRVIRGTPYYTSNIGLQTVPLEAVRGTELLTCQSATIIDNSTTGYAISANGDVKVKEFNPFAYNISSTPVKYDANLLGGSVYFDGAGDYLTVTNSNSLILSNVFTIQGWFYKSTPFNANSAIVSKGTATTGWQVMIHNSNTLMFSNATSNINSVTPVRPYEWNHFAVVRGAVANRTLLFLNGNLEATSNIVNPFAETNDMYIGSGRVAGANVFTGYISDLRIDSTALYANSFAPSYNSVNTTKNAAFILDKRTAIIDYSLKNSVETSGNVKIKQFSPFNTDGTYSYYLDGTSGYLTVPPGNIANISGSFTLELWYYPITASGNKFLFGTWNNNQQGWGLWVTPPASPSNSQYIFFYYGNYGSNEAYIGATNGAAQLGKWSHIAVTRDNNNNFWFFLDGQRLSTTTFGSGLSWSNTTNFVNTTTNFINIGGASNYATTHGYISNLRFVANSSIYTGNFTPPTAPLPIVQSASANVLAIAPLPVGGYGVNFDGTGDYLSIPGAKGTALDLSTGAPDWTIEAWYNISALTSGSQVIMSKDWQSGSTNASYAMSLQSNGQFFYFFGNGTSGAYSQQYLYTIPGGGLGVWNHVAMARSGSNILCFFNGTLVQTIAITGTLVDAGNPVRIGSTNNPSEYVLGIISNARIVKGQAVYTGNFTVPTSPLGLSQSASTNITALTSTDVTNGNSVFFDGTGDYLSVPHHTGLNLATGDFTLECWFKAAALPASGAQVILSKDGVSGTSYSQYKFHISSTGILQAFIGTGDGASGGKSDTNYLPSYTIALNTWYHIAMTRSGTTLYIFVNGVQQYGAVPGQTMLDGGKSLLIGYETGQAATTYFNGWIHGVRIVKGTALYTANGQINLTQPVTNVSGTTLLTVQNNTLIDTGNSAVITASGDAKVSWNESPFNYSNVKLLTAQSSSIIDNSLNGSNNIITVNGDARIIPEGPFGKSNVRLLTGQARNYTDVSLANVRILPVGNVRVVTATPVLNSNTIASNILTIGQSFYFSGAGQDFISLPAGSDTFAFGTGDFTVEFWMYNQSATTGEYEIIESGTNNAFTIYKRASSSGFSFRGFANTDVLIATDATMANVANSWVHVAVSRSNINTRAYINGLVASNTIDRVNYVLSNTVVTIGARTGGSNYFTGYLADLRVTKGVARYTTDLFTPPNKLPSYTSSYKAGTPLVIEAIIVGGGGAGGAGAPGNFGGGGGGAGGAITTNISVIANQVYPIVIGSGASAPTSATISNSGSGTSAFGYGAEGGGGGGAGPTATNGLYGGSGGGSAYASNTNSAEGVIGQGFPGSAASFPSYTTGGSGAGGIAQAWRSNVSFGYQKGGTGIKWVDGNYYAGGGGGFVIDNWSANNSTAFASFGGGGEGGRTLPSANAATSGGTNTGGGGGGGTAGAGAAGGSGVVVIRYPMAYPTITSTTANVIMTETGDFRYYKFTSSGNVVFPFSTLTVPPPDKTPTVEYLVVAGGGGGGFSYGGGGGGAGGFRTANGLPVIVGSRITVTVGAGGAGGAPIASNGSDSVFGTITSTGGGRGSGNDYAANTGGSGGGGRQDGAPGSRPGAVGNTPPTSPSQGNAGGTGWSQPAAGSGGGGGGAGAAGSNASSGVGANGGIGVYSTITGTNVAYAGGGGGATEGGIFGIGTFGGGNGGYNGSFNGTSGQDNTGGGGGGGGGNGGIGGNGGKGVVIIRYSNSYPNATSTTNMETGYPIENNGYKIYKWITSGTITF
jgi:hypothetical protein